MTLSNYDELRASIAGWLHRDDLTDVIPDFIKGAEQLINYGAVDTPALRVAEMETTATVSLASGVGTLPSGFLSARRVRSMTSPARVLEAVTPEWASERFPSAGAGDPAFFTIIGSSIQVYPATSSNLSITYYSAVPPLASNSTNWLLTKAPMIYLYGSLIHSAPYLGDDGRAQTWGSLYRNAVSGLSASDIRGRFGRMGTRTRSPTP